MKSVGVGASPAQSEKYAKSEASIAQEKLRNQILGKRPRRDAYGSDVRNGNRNKSLKSPSKKHQDGSEDKDEDEEYSKVSMIRNRQHLQHRSLVKPADGLDGSQKAVTQQDNSCGTRKTNKEFNANSLLKNHGNKPDSGDIRRGDSYLDNLLAERKLKKERKQQKTT